MNRVTRTGVSLKPELLEKFDCMIKKAGYKNRSEAIRDLVRDALAKAVVENPNAQVFGTLTIVYDHDASNVLNKLLDHQHRFYRTIILTNHVHIDERNCLEVLILRGKMKNVKNLADTIRATKGVLKGDMVLTTARF